MEAQRRGCISTASVLGGWCAQTGALGLEIFEQKPTLNHPPQYIFQGREASSIMHLFNTLLSLFPFVFKVPKAGANLKGEKKERGYTRHGAEVTLGKEHLQPKALHVHFWQFFFPQQCVKLYEHFSPDGSLYPLSFCQCQCSAMTKTNKAQLHHGNAA